MRIARRTMEDAAVGIAYDEGVGAVTVDRVCEVAMVSRSTFFNYFPSLDHAIFGSPLVYDPALTERILRANGDDLVIAASRIVMESVRGQGDDELLRKRFALFAREPGTTTTVSWSAGTSRTGLVDVIEAWLDAHPASARLVDADHATEARMIVNFSITLGDEVMRLVGEDGGDFPFEPAVFRTVRERMLALSAPAR
ncbi:TetR family transcriptional regulator [Microbacterium sp. bgisy203]|uniref:TetR family transcriptional regulator n=1 Tax=Microbacterium sp. bgisy203 TaxID=3413799 RepID=UPI003D714B2F